MAGDCRIVLVLPLIEKQARIDLLLTLAGFSLVLIIFYPILFANELLHIQSCNCNGGRKMERSHMKWIYFSKSSIVYIVLLFY